MKIVLPRASRGYGFPHLFVVEMNDFDVERLLPSLFYLVVTRGRERAHRGNDPKAFDKYLSALAQHRNLEGFGDSAGVHLLGKWIRASIIHTGKVGRAKREEQIEYVLPLTLLTYKTGFPSEIRRQRNVHVFLYQVLIKVLEALDARPSPQTALWEYFRMALGKGVNVGPAPRYDGAYDGTAQLDIHALLSLYYLDGFQSTEASRREAGVLCPAMPGAAELLGQDVLRYLLAYYRHMPPLALTRGLMALIDFELFVYTGKLLYAGNALTRTGGLSAVARDREGKWNPEVYVDFTRVRGGLSDEMARAAVERDLEELRAFFDTIIRLRTLHRFVEFQPAVRARLEGQDGPEYLENLVKVADDPGIEARAQAEIESIHHETLEACQGSVEEQEAEGLFDEVKRRSHGKAVDFAVQLLADAQRKQAIESYVRWFWSVGGLRKPFGILEGNFRGRRNWRYAMRDDLLATLVQLAMVEDPSGRLDHVTIRPRLRLQDFLGFMERRFGVIVDRPPRFLDTASSREAAGQNLDALKQLLRQMGFFEALSDDFTAQYLRAPLLEEVTA